MGSKRRAEDPDSGHRAGPKLTVTGRLEGSFASRPVELLAEGREMSLRVENLRSAWILGKTTSAATAPFMRTLRGYGIRLHLNIGRRWRIDLLPKPNLFLRMLVPSLRPFTA